MPPRRLARGFFALVATVALRWRGRAAPRAARAGQLDARDRWSARTPTARRSTRSTAAASARSSSASPRTRTCAARGAARPRRRALPPRSSAVATLIAVRTRAPRPLLAADSTRARRFRRERPPRPPGRGCAAFVRRLWRVSGSGGRRERRPDRRAGRGAPRHRHGPAAGAPRRRAPARAVVRRAERERGARGAREVVEAADAGVGAAGGVAGGDRAEPEVDHVIDNSACVRGCVLAVVASSSGSEP